MRANDIVIPRIVPDRTPKDALPNQLLREVFRISREKLPDDMKQKCGKTRRFREPRSCHNALYELPSWVSLQRIFKTVLSLRGC